MSVLDFVFVTACVIMIAFQIFLLLRLSKERDFARRGLIKKLMKGTLSGLLVIISAFAVSIVYEPISSEARSYAAQRNTANYTLARDIFEYRENIVLTLHFKGAPVLNVVEWDVSVLPPEVVSANINKINGQSILTFTGIPPRTNYTINITAVVIEANSPCVSIPLAILINNGTAF